MTAKTLCSPAYARWLKAVVERRMRENRTSGVARGEGASASSPTRPLKTLLQSPSPKAERRRRCDRSRVHGEVTDVQTVTAVIVPATVSSALVGLRLPPQAECRTPLG